MTNDLQKHVEQYGIKSSYIIAQKLYYVKLDFFLTSYTQIMRHSSTFKNSHILHMLNTKPGYNVIYMVSGVIEIM